MKSSRKIWIGYWPSFALGGAALALSAVGWWQVSLLFSALSTAHTFFRFRTDKKSARSAPHWPGVATRMRPGAFEPFAVCPGCDLPGYHLFYAPREKVERAPAYLSAKEIVGGDRWWPMDDYEVVTSWNYDGPCYFIRSGRRLPNRTVTVVDRECLSCGKKWEEVPN